MNKLFSNPNEGDLPLSKLKLEPVVNQSAVQHKFNVLAKRNLRRQQIYDRMLYKPVEIQRRIW